MSHARIQSEARKPPPRPAPPSAPRALCTGSKLAQQRQHGCSLRLTVAHCSSRSRCNNGFHAVCGKDAGLLQVGSRSVCLSRGCVSPAVIGCLKPTPFSLPVASLGRAPNKTRLQRSACFTCPRPCARAWLVQRRYGSPVGLQATRRASCHRWHAVAAPAVVADPTARPRSQARLL